MFGIGLYDTYASFKIDFLGGLNAAVLVTLTIRLLVGIGWYRMFEKAGKKGSLAFIPFVGSYTAFRLVWDDFSFSFLFASTTFISWIAAMGIRHPIVDACAWVAFILWWFSAFLTARAYQTNTFICLVYGGIPWAGVPLVGFWPAGAYKGPWSSDPEADQNLTKEERKKRRRKAEREAKEARKKR